VNPVWLRVLAWAVAIIIGVLNAWLLFTTIRGWGAGGGLGI
jgi:manganese transport protein